MIKQLILFFLIIIFIVLNNNFKEKFSIYLYKKNNLEDLYKDKEFKFYKTPYLCNDYTDLVIK